MNEKTQYLLLGALTASAWWGLSMLIPHMNKDNPLAFFYWIIPLGLSLATFAAIIEDSN